MSKSSGRFARWGWDWLAPDLSLYPIVSAYGCYGARQNTGTPECQCMGTKGRPEYQSAVRARIALPRRFDGLVNEFSYVSLTLFRDSSTPFRLFKNSLLRSVYALSTPIALFPFVQKIV